MAYSKKYLINLSDQTNFGSEEHTQVTNELINKLQNHETLTLAEEEYACTAIHTLHDDNGIRPFKPSDYQGCKNYWFRNRYLIHYKDLDCKGSAFDAFGEISSKDIARDREFLNNQFIEWESIIVNAKINDRITQYISTETKHHIKLIKRYCEENNIDSVDFEYKRKAIILHGKFIYLVVKEYFDELGLEELKLQINQHNILLDQYCYVHILFRHYAALIKEYQLNKSYHFDKQIEYDYLPDFLIKIMEEFNRIAHRVCFDERSIAFKYSGTLYEIWFRPMTRHLAGNTVENYLRLQTLYPVEAVRDIDRINGFDEIEINDKLTFIVKNIT
jgi:hypothetical protein